MAKKKVKKKTAKKSTKKTTKKKKTKKLIVKKSTSKKKTIRKKSGTKKKTGRARHDSVVTIASENYGDVSVPLGAELQELAMRWRYTLSRRLRWRGSSRADMQKAAYEALNELTAPEKLEHLCEAGVIEIQVPYRSERMGWEGRVAPWEYLISSAIKEARKKTGSTEKNSATIVRHLQTKHEELPAMEFPNALYIECAPGVLSDHYEFTNERAAVEQLFGADLHICINPTIAELGQQIQKIKPNIIHIAGIDNNQAKELLRNEDILPKEWQTASKQSKEKYFDDRDGIVFASDNPNNELGLEPIDAEMLAQTLNSAGSPLHLVTTNVYHSASRICALAVAEGAGLAVGFQDTVQDSLAEIFLLNFYKIWLENNDPLSGFVGGIDIARASVSLKGTGIVLWSAKSLLKDNAGLVYKNRQTRKENKEKVLDVIELLEAKELSVNIKVRDRLNYSLLHNDSGGLFEEFEIKKPLGILKDINVEVVLYLGSESHPYNSRMDLTEEKTQIKDKVKIPLTSSIIRTVSEQLRTSLYVRVSVGNQLIHSDTYRVTLLPADEWKDTDADRIWLPSFILPRDHAIEEIIDTAQKHLVTLADDRDCGFAGYQGIEIDEDGNEDFRPVDLQVQAIWSAVANDLKIRYINPPPSYSLASQRLRTPSQILRAGRGTCIDLALLLASCLEYIDIYPVIFLLKGHAFTGYWRSEDCYYDFINTQQSLDNETMRDSIGASDGVPWILPSHSYVEVMNEIKMENLYPVETVGFTDHGSFWASIADAEDELAIRSDYHALIDVIAARENHITPLPILEDYDE